MIALSAVSITSTFLLFTGHLHGKVDPTGATPSSQEEDPPDLAHLGKCTGEHAFGALDALQADLKSYCGGRIACVHRRLDFPESFCRVQHLEMDVSLFNEFMLHPLNTTEKYPYFVTGEPRGLFSLDDCNFDSLPEALFGKGSSGLLHGAFRKQPRRDCREVEHTVMFIAHAYEKYNPWHTMEDLLHTYESSRLFGVDEAQLVLLDAPRNTSARDVIQPFHEVYERVFSPRLGFATAHELVDSHRRDTRCLRFQGAIFQPHGGSSALQRSVGEDTQCFGSPLIRGFVHRILSRIPGLSAVRSNPNLTVYLNRGPSAKRKFEHPEWDALIQNATGVDSLVVDMATLPILEQMKLARGAGTLIGQHGAALSHGMWMHPNASLVEVDVQKQCSCYHNIARWNRLRYELRHV
jgi:hypothetical protein